MPKAPHPVPQSSGDQSATEVSRPRMAGLWLLLSAIGVAATWWLLWGTSLPLGIPDQWTWVRLSLEPDVPWNLLLAIPFAVGYGVLVWQGRRRLDRAGTSETALFLVALGLAGFAWLWVIQESGPTAQRLSKGPFVLFYPQSSGYFYKVRYEGADATTFLARYEDLMAEGDVLHVGTHPPGLFLLFFGLRDVCEASTALTDLLLATQPESVRLADESVVENSAASQPPREVRRTDLAALWLAELLAQGLAVLTVWPLYGLLRRTESRSTAYVLSACWPLVPAVAIFLPKSDVAYAGLAVLWMWTWLRATDRGSWSLAVLAGVVAWLGMLCSLAFLPVFLAGVVAAVVELAGVSDPGERRSRLYRLAGMSLAAGAVFLALTALLWFQADVNLPRVWLMNYRNHAGFYGKFPRSYTGWLLLNPLELSIAVGVPIAILGAAGGLYGWADGGRTRAVTAGVVGVWGLLWLTGKNSGEAARLWTLLMPWCLWLAGPALRRANVAWFVAGWIGLQLAAQVVTVLRVGGFHY